VGSVISVSARRDRPAIETTPSREEIRPEKIISNKSCVSFSQPPTIIHSLHCHGLYRVVEDEIVRKIL
jgi:hypothetical protein